MNSIEIKIIKKMILASLKYEEYIHENQRGFMRGRPTQENIRDVVQIGKDRARIKCQYLINIHRFC